MAFVVRRPGQRFEIRESVSTGRGPRSRSLANFSVLTDDVLAAAHQRATRSFDADGVVASARRAGAPVRSRSQVRRFVEASRRLAADIGGSTPSPRDPGEALMDLLGFTDVVMSARPHRPAQPLAYPPLVKLLASRR